MPEVRALAPRRVEIVGDGGLVLRGDAYGDAAAPPIILLHGGGQTRHAWGDTARRLAEAGFYAVSMDLRGHGDSAWAENGDYAMERYVGDLLKVAESLPAKPALVGASMGGITSLLAQGEHPSLAWAVVLVDIATTAQPAGLKRIFDFMNQKPEGFESLEEVADAIAAYQPHRKRPTNLEGLAKNVRRGTDGRYRWHWDPAFIASKGPEHDPMRADRLANAARALRVPTMLVRGRQSDVIAQSDVQQFLSYAPHAEFVDVRDAGHMVAGDVNDVFSDVVIEFLTRHRPTRSPSMAKISSDVFVAVPPSRAFEALGSFADASWVPGTARVEVAGHGVGAVRTLTTVDGAQIKERLESYDADARRYSYSIVEAPMPIRNYLSTLEVHAEGTGARVRWSASFEADAGVQAALQGLYDSAMKGLLERFG